MTAARAAREAWIRSAHEEVAGWSAVESRRERYALLWRYYDNDLYDDLGSYKSNRGLYRHIRGIYNPAGRLVDFYVAKIWGGKLDFSGDGGAIPIEAKNAAVMPALKEIWKWSNWEAKKNLAVRWGACLGDMVLKVVDDRERGKVFLQVLHPRVVKSAEFDLAGNVRAAVIEYVDGETDEEGNYDTFTYREEITKGSFSTFRDDDPYDYYGYGTTWPNDYGFVPLVIGPHKDVGHDWGASCFHNGLRTIDEVNDQVSVFSDRMRTGNNPPWLLSGVSRGRDDADIDLSSDGATTGDQSRRQQENVLYGDVGAKGQALVTDVGLSETLDYVALLFSEVEQKFPELSLHRLRQKGQVPRMESVAILYEDVRDKVVEARGNYDAALVRAQKMALSIAGLRGLVEGFDLESFESGDEEHVIGDRAVFLATDSLPMGEMGGDDE